jgi:hypothetical protein
VGTAGSRCAEHCRSDQTLAGRCLPPSCVMTIQGRQPSPKWPVRLVACVELPDGDLRHHTGAVNKPHAFSCHKSLAAVEGIITCSPPVCRRAVAWASA